MFRDFEEMAYIERVKKVSHYVVKKLPSFNALVILFVNSKILYYPSYVKLAIAIYIPIVNYNFNLHYIRESAMKFESLYKSTPLQDHKYAHNDTIKSSMKWLPPFRKAICIRFYYLLFYYFFSTMID